MGKRCLWVVLTMKRKYFIMIDNDGKYYAEQSDDGLILIDDENINHSQPIFEYLYSIQEEIKIQNEKDKLNAELDRDTRNIPYRRYIYLDLLCAECNYHTAVCINHPNSEQIMSYLTHCAVPMLIIGVDIEKGKMFHNRVVKQETIYKRSYLISPVKED